MAIRTYGGSAGLREEFVWRRDRLHPGNKNPDWINFLSPQAIRARRSG